MKLADYQKILTEVIAGNSSITEDNESSTISITTKDEILNFLVINKTLQSPISLKDILVQGDTKSRNIHFVMNRYFDGIDLSNKHILVNYKNAKDETGYDSIDNLEVTEEQMEFDWWVNSQVTALEGEVSIQLELSEYNEVGDVIYRFQTTTTELNIEKTIISSGNAEPVDYYLDIQFLNEYSDPIIYENMVSSSVPIYIENRTIIMPELDTIAINQDCRSRLLTFIISRYIDNVDLSQKTICIKYKLTDGSGDRSFACNKVITDTNIKFDWLLDSKTTSLPGEVIFAIEFIGYNEKNEFYCYNTLPNHFIVTKGLNVDNIIEQPSVSWIQSWSILAESYLKEYLKYIGDIKEYKEQAMASAAEAVIAMQKAIASEISAENDAGIAWQQADRAERMANLVAGNTETVISTMSEFIEKYTEFLSEYNNIRKKDEPIEKNDLAVSLQLTIDGKAEKNHTHNATDIIQDSAHKFVTTIQLENLVNARLKTVSIKESDLDADLANKINSGSGSGGGIIVSGAQIDDTAPSYSKVYSSQATENKIKTAVGSAVSGLEGLSDNNFTDAEKQKLARIEDNANYFTLTTVSASIVEETATRKFVSPTEKQTYIDKYTKAEVDNLISSLSSGMVWKPDVPTYEDIATTYPKPIKDWCVSTANGDTYLYDGEKWIKIGSGKTPLATTIANGLMSSIDKKKLDGVATGANNYEHPKNHSADIITETSNKKFATSSQLNAINNIDTSISNALTNYRKNSVKILETDLDPTLLEKLSTAGGTIINDNVTSLSQTYSSAVIDAKLSKLDTKIGDRIQEILADVATTKDIDALFV